MHRFRRYPPWSVWVCVALICAVAGRYLWQLGGSNSPRAVLGISSTDTLAPGTFEVVRIERADLVVVRQQEREMTLQLLGVKLADDSTRGFAESGRQYTADLLSSGLPALELDRRRLDNRGHFLGYVRVGDKLLNEELVRAGLAKADIYPGDNQAMHRSFIKAEKDARKAGRGIWSHGSP